MSDNTVKDQGSKKTVIIVVIVAVVMVAMLATIIVLASSLGKKDKAEEELRPVMVTEENAEEVVEQLIEQEKAAEVAPGYYTVTMNTTWHFESGDVASYDAIVENVEGNTNDVYFDVLLESDESVVLYKSPIIPRGGELKSITLDQVLPAGTYPAVVEYNLVDENQVTLSTVRVGLTIIVEN
jgi:NADH:ubiquinone oxidoreductase subunit 3 (subunit A)